LRERGSRPVDLANTPAASPPPLLARSRKALRASAGACNARPACARFLPLSFIVIGRLFPAGHAASRSGSPDIGAVCCPMRSDFRCDLAQTSSQHPEPLAGRKRPATSQSPGCLQLVAPPAIPEPGSAASALEPLLDPPPTQGCASSKHGIPGGWPAGSAVWPRLIITPGKLRVAL